MLPIRWRLFASGKEKEMSDKMKRTEAELRNAIAQAVRDARERKPLAGSVTNTVTQNFVANAQLAVGGSAAMVYLPDEAEFLADNGDSMYINLGTLIPNYAETVPRGAEALHAAGKPWVLDPVGIGIGSLRTQLVKAVKPFKPTVLRGNASEIIAVADMWGLIRPHVSQGDASGITQDADEAAVQASDISVSDADATDDGSAGPRGVDSTDEVESARQSAIAVANYTGGAVMVSGKTDLVTDGKTVAMVEGGSPLFESITGSGCSLGGVVAVYAAVADPFVAALTATAIYDAAGTKAGSIADAPASFQIAFLDELYKIEPEEVAQAAITLE